MKTLYKWQKITLWIIGILTFVAVSYNTLGKEFNFGYFLDLITAVGINILILWLLFQIGNWIYRSIKRNKNEEKIGDDTIKLGWLTINKNEKIILIIIVIATIIIAGAIIYTNHQKAVKECKMECDYNFALKIWEYSKEGRWHKEFPEQDQCIDYCLNVK